MNEKLGTAGRDAGNVSFEESLAELDFRASTYCSSGSCAEVALNGEDHAFVTDSKQDGARHPGNTLRFPAGSLHMAIGKLVEFQP